MTYKIEENGNSRIVHLTGEIDMDVACLLYTSDAADE